MKIIFFLICFLSGTCFCFADTIILKNGKTIEGKIYEKADTYIKVNIAGVELTFYKDEIKEIIPDVNEPNIDMAKYGELAKAALADKVLEASGEKKQLEQIYSYVLDSYAQHKDRIAPELYARGRQIVSFAYSVDKMYQSVREYFIKNFNRERLSAIKDFYESELARKITDLEIKASSAEALEEIKKFGDELIVNPPPASRTELIKRLDAVTGGTRLQLEVMVATFEAIAKAVDPLLPSDKRLREGELEQIRQTLRASLEPVLDNAVSVSFLYTYQPLSNEQLQQYINFWLSDSGRWLTRTNEEATIAAINKAGDETIKAFAGMPGEIEIQGQAPTDKRLRETTKPIDTGGL